MRIGCIGVGKMGGGLARNLIRSGYDVVVYDIDREAVKRVLKVGGSAVHSPSEMAAMVDVLFTSLPLPKHLTDLLIDESGILDQMQPGSTVIDVSTIDPRTARLISDAASQRGLQFLACPLGKGPVQAEEGTQPIYAGGKREVFDQFESHLNKISTSVHYIGDVEQATAFKIISNLIGMTNVIVLCESLRLGEKFGIEQQFLQKLLATTGADSYQLTLRGPKILNQEYTPGFSVNLTLKDIRLGVSMANDLNQPTPFGSLAMEFFQRAQNSGLGEEDCAAVYKLFE
ncbi:NAD(P)-dependent oxidoreductase [Fodinisporobacter ferrooxydans]|uniref:NAD(P)-dependent oxidoreductase n=1 Tax=Fodinisporobacter ferrooxydans TaxID=2901836 RepID=A0ABY4CGU1_9BACL|nr:NAD(P)-dependent oxidoreductase [Alicyclobacillaceae bacterium MYW30-H2]